MQDRTRWLQGAATLNEFRSLRFQLECTLKELLRVRHVTLYLGNSRGFREIHGLIVNTLESTH